MSTDPPCNPHYWRCGTRKKDGDYSYITLEHCLKCGAERDLIEIWKKKGLLPIRKYTPIRYTKGKPEVKEDTKMAIEEKSKLDQDQGPESQEGQEKETIQQGGAILQQSQEKPPPISKRGGDTSIRSQYYEQNKEAILADYDYMGFSATARKWEIPRGSMSGLFRKWGVKTSGPRKKTGKSEDHMAKRNKTEALADKLIADLHAGISFKEICRKYDVSEKSLENFRRRHGFYVGKKPSKNNPTERLVTLVDQIFDEEDQIVAAHARWKGVRAVLLIEVKPDDAG